MADLIPLTKGAHGFGGSYDGGPLGSLDLMVVDGVLSDQVAASVTDRKGTAGRSDSPP